MAEENSDTFHCHCGKQFKRSSAYRRHQEVAHSTCASHKCSECGKTFGNANTLTMHMSVHEKREAFTRLVRPATRSTRSTLRVLQEEAGTGGVLGTAAAAALSAGSNQQSGASSTQQTPATGKEAEGGGELPRCKRQPTREAKHDIGGSSSSSSNQAICSVLQSDCIRQTRAGAKEASNINSSSSSRRTSPAAAPTTTSSTPAAAVQERDSGAGTRARTAAAAEATASVAAAAASPAAPAAEVKVEVVGVSGETSQQQQQQQQREGAGGGSRSDRLLLHDEVCNDAAGSLRVEQPRGGRVAVVADKADPGSSGQGEEAGAVEQRTGGGRAGAREHPAGREESKLQADGPPDGHLTNQGKERWNDTRCTPANKHSPTPDPGYSTQWAGAASVNNVVSTVGNPTSDGLTTAPTANPTSAATRVHGGSSDINDPPAPGHQSPVSDQPEEPPVTTIPSSTSGSSSSSTAISTVGLQTTTAISALPGAATTTHPPRLNGNLTERHALSTDTDPLQRDSEGEEQEEDEDDCYGGADGNKPAIRKSSRDRKENPIWKTLLTGRMYEEVLSSVDSARGGPPSKRARRTEHDHLPAPPCSLAAGQQQPSCGYNLTMIPTTVVKQEPMEYGFNLDNIKQELVETDDESGQGLPEMVSLQYQRLKRGPVRRTRSGSLPGGGQLQRSSPTATFDCLVCGKTFISEKYLSMHISLHETSKIEPGGGLGEDGDTMCPGQISVKDLTEGEIYKSLESAPELPNIPAMVEQISVANNTNHFKPSPPKKSPSNNGSSNNGSSNSKKPTKLQTDGGWSCSLCNKTFAHNSGYKNHMRTHSNERPYVCQICDIGFKEKYHLKKHNLFIHSNELPEKCRVCGKRFKDSTAVRAHERIHSDERPFACRQCSKTFKTSECLWHHEHRSKTCGLALGEIIAQERLVRRRRRFPKSGGHNNVDGGAQQQSPRSPASGSDTNPETSPMGHDHEANGDLAMAYKWNSHAHHMSQPHQQHQQHQPPAQHHHEQLSNGHGHAHPHTQHPHPHPHQKLTNVDQYMPPVTNFFPMSKENTSNAAKHSLIASQLQSCVQTLHHPEVTSALQQTPLPLPPNQPQVPLCVEQHNMSPPPASEDDRLSPTNLAMTMTMKDLNCLTEIPHGMHPHEDEMMVAHSMYPVMSAAEIKQERDAFGYSMDEDEENWVTTNMDKIMDKEDDLIDSKVDAILSNMASSMSSAFGMLAGDPLPSPPTVDFTDGKEYRCRVCRKGFGDLVSYQRHAKVHSDERPFVCMKCDIGFKMKVHLKKHNLYVHSSEYPCECQHCGKKFKDSSAVKLHERTHSDTRPFGCTGCGKAFKTRENLWGHQHRGKCVAGRTRADQEGCFEEPTSAKASVVNNGMSAHATVNGNGVTAQACLNNSQVTAHASIENNQITAHATFANNQFTAHASVINNQVTAHASINTNVTAQANLQNGTFTYSNSHHGGRAPTGSPPHVVTSMTDSKTMSGSIPSTTTASPMAIHYGGNPPTMTKSFIAQSLMTPPLNKSAGGATEGATLRTGQQQQNASPTAGSLPVTCPTSLPDAGTDSVTTTAQAQKKASDGAAAKWPTLKEFLSKGIGPPTPVPTWSGVPAAITKVNGQANTNNNNNNNTNNNNNNNGEYKQLANDYPALKERLSRNFFSQLPTVVTVAPPPPASSSSANNTSYPSSPASSNLSAPYSGQTTPTAGTSPYGKGRDSVSPYSDYSPSSGSGAIPSFQSTFLKRNNPPPLYGNNPMLRGEDPNVPIIYWDDESDQRPPSSVWTSPESDSMFQDISESVFTQL